MIMLCVLAALAGWTAAQEPEGEPWEKYEALIERNPFSRVRGRRPEPTRESRPSSPPPPAESFYELKGVAQTGDSLAAFLEDIRNGIEKVGVGEEIAGGTVVEINLDGLVFEKGGQRRSVAIGSRLSGGSSSATGSGEARSSVAPADEASLLERLRQRRAQELNR